jgi:hypothetical protein
MNMPQKLAGQIAVITGGSGGIGLATANGSLMKALTCSSPDAGKANWKPL